MGTQSNLKISIPKPCHEDWNKFTPDEKGAFCKVCSKSVHDFTKKTVEEINTILTEEISAGKKVCGRFNEDQLEAPTLKGGNTEFSGGKQLDTYSLNFQRMKKFALALFLVFGGYLFNTTKSSAQKLMGKVMYVPRPEPIKGEVSPDYPAPPKDTTNVIADSVEIMQQKNLKYGTPMPMGDVMIEPVEEPIGITGTVELMEEFNEPIIGDTTKSQEPEEEDVASIMGMIALPLDYFKPFPPVPVNSVPEEQSIEVSPNDSTVADEFAVEESTFVEANVVPTLKGEDTQNSTLQGEGQGALTLEYYPNPSADGEITLRYNLAKDGMTSISLFDLTGNLVKTLLPLQSLYASSYQTKYDVSDLKNGIYFCELSSGNNKTTQQIVISK